MQTALLVFLLVKIDAVEMRVDELQRPVTQTAAEAIPAVLSPRTGPANVPAVVGSRELRRIVREELRAAADNSTVLSRDTVVGTGDTVADEAELQYQRDLVMEEFESLKQQEEVSSEDLEGLMGDIAQLDSESRTRLLKLLNQAMNRGEIKGHL